MQIFCLTILRVSSRTFFDFSSDFFCLLSSFLSNLYCSLSEVKLVANINWLQHIKNKVLIAQLEVLGVTVREVSGSNPRGGKVFAPMKQN